jgi:hypothetical protein
MHLYKSLQFAYIYVCVCVCVCVCVHNVEVMVEEDLLQVM